MGSPVSREDTEAPGSRSAATSGCAGTKSAPVQAHPCLGPGPHTSPSPPLPLPPPVPVSRPLCSLTVSLASSLPLSPRDVFPGSFWPSGPMNALGPASRALPCPTSPLRGQLHLPVLLPQSGYQPHPACTAEHPWPSTTTQGRAASLMAPEVQDVTGPLLCPEAQHHQPRPMMPAGCSSPGVPLLLWPCVTAVVFASGSFLLQALS